MKKLNIPEYYPRYYKATDHPEIMDVEKMLIYILGCMKMLDFLSVHFLFRMP